MQVVKSWKVKILPHGGMPYNMAQVFGVQDTTIADGEWELTLSKKEELKPGDIYNA